MLLESTMKFTSKIERCIISDKNLKSNQAFPLVIENLFDFAHKRKICETDILVPHDFSCMEAAWGLDVVKYCDAITGDKQQMEPITILVMILCIHDLI